MRRVMSSVVCAAGLLIGSPVLAATITLDVGFSHTATAGSPSVYSVSNTFMLPAGFSAPVLTVTSLGIDDRGVLQLNGTTVTNAGIFGPGNGFMTFTAAGSNDPFTFTFGNGPQSIAVTTGFLPGPNTLTVLVNDTNNGINGLPLATGVNISGFEFVGTVRFNERDPASVPEPATFGLLAASLLGLAWRRVRA